MERKTAKEIVELIASTYNQNNRSTNPSATTMTGKPRCLYNGPDGKHCAFAFLVKPEQRHILTTFETECASTVLRKMPNILSPEFSGHDTEFYNDLQSLHDNANNWDENGLTGVGRSEADNIIRVYSKWTQKN